MNFIWQLCLLDSLRDAPPRGSQNFPDYGPRVLQKLFPGGMTMLSSEYWKLFLETGAPEAYLLYTQSLRQEERHVSDGSGHRPAGDGLQ